MYRIDDISIHAPAGGATSPYFPSVLQSSDFNPRSRRGSDCIHRKNPLELEISIHAPARGATSLSEDGTGVTLFQSTLPQGERLYNGKSPNQRAVISIHAPAGGATRYIITCTFFFNISIHAPAGGATSQLLFPDLLRLNFNPRSRRGSDQISYSSAKIVVKFQSTLPQGERHLKSAL